MSARFVARVTFIGDPPEKDSKGNLTAPNWRNDTVQVMRKGTSRALQLALGEFVQVGDTIVCDPKLMIQIQTGDGTLVVLRNGAKLTLSERGTNGVLKHTVLQQDGGWVRVRTSKAASMGGFFGQTDLEDSHADPEQASSGYLTRVEGVTGQPGEVVWVTLTSGLISANGWRIDHKQEFKFKELGQQEWFCKGERKRKEPEESARLDQKELESVLSEIPFVVDGFFQVFDDFLLDEYPDGETPPRAVAQPTDLTPVTPENPFVQPPIPPGPVSP